MFLCDWECITTSLWPSWGYATTPIFPIVLSEMHSQAVLMQHSHHFSLCLWVFLFNAGPILRRRSQMS